MPVTLQGAHELQIQCSDLTFVQRELPSSVAAPLQEFRIHVLAWLQVFERNRVVVTGRQSPGRHAASLDAPGARLEHSRPRPASKGLRAKSNDVARVLNMRVVRS